MTFTRAVLLTAVVTAIAAHAFTSWLVAASAAADSPRPGVWPEFVEIAAGPFTMGAAAASDPQALDNERWSATQGTGRVELPAFYLSRHEVTVAQYAAFVRATSWTVDQRTLSGPPDHPVTFVSWPDALAYCRWLQTALVKAPETPAPIAERLRAGWQVTLPSEAEWEKGARGSDGRPYPWGAEARRDRANFAGTQTSPVGQYECPECAYGLADMSGNVWEWTNSCDNNPNLPDDGEDCRRRGGSYFSSGDTTRCAIDSVRPRAERNSNTGFRCCITN